MNTREWLKRRLAEGPILLAPGVFDPLSAKVVQRCGFEAVYVSGGAISRSLGFPDLGLVTMTEMLDRIAAICEATDLPVIADADTGYGNPLNVRRTVREWERAGVAALHLEDQVTPKKCGHYEGKALISREEMVQKVRAAVEARRDGVLIVARTDARAVEGLEGALARARAYREAGADVLFVEAPQSVQEIEAIARSLPGPLMINIFAGGKTPVVPARELDRLGYRLAIYPGELQRAALHAMLACAQHLRETGTVDGFAQVVSFQEREVLVDADRWASLEARYATGG
ncbi:MAG: isocitrate lyase/PEP mutase family protein [Armatimonadota bacterium]|nr:isocitrate lyase/PEP mutase family protein [Armatimonadota bacterium]